jgi:hypothetical protein
MAPKQIIARLQQQWVEMVNELPLWHIYVMYESLHFSRDEARALLATEAACEVARAQMLQYTSPMPGIRLDGAQLGPSPQHSKFDGVVGAVFPDGCRLR